MARPEGFEPPTTRFEAWYSIQLSYRRTIPALYSECGSCVAIFRDSELQALEEFLR